MSEQEKHPVDPDDSANLSGLAERVDQLKDKLTFARYDFEYAGVNLCRENDLSPREWGLAKFDEGWFFVRLPPQPPGD